MFVYNYATIPEPFGVIERRVLHLLGGLPGFAEVAYRRGEQLHARLTTDSGRSGQDRSSACGGPLRAEMETSIPVVWEATGPSVLFPRMDADIVVSSVGPELTHLSLRGRYKPPLGAVGRMLDRRLLHRVAEASIEDFIDRLARAVAGSERDAETARR